MNGPLHLCKNVLSLAVAVAWLAGCGSTQTLLQPGAGVTATTSPSEASPRTTREPRLYVGGSNISEYLLGHTHPLRSVPAYVATPKGMAVDSLGNLFAIVASGSDELLQIYNARTLKMRPGYLPYGGAIAIDANSYVYLRDYDSITVLTPGGAHKLRVMRKKVQYPGPMAFDRFGKLYAGDFSGITVFAPTGRPGYMSYERRITKGIASPRALAFGPSDELFVANCRRCPYSQPGTRKDWISVYARNGSTPVRRFYDGADGLKQPIALAVDSKGRLYVANYSFGKTGGERGGEVAVYAADSSNRIKTITQGVDAPLALAIDPSDNLYVANWFGGTVTVYSPGGAQLLQTIKDGAGAAQALLISAP